jgi:hypothetical protein
MAGDKDELQLYKECYIILSLNYNIQIFDI